MPNSKAPQCPWCAKPMTYVRTTPHAGGHASKHRYECKRCIIDFTEIDGAGELAPDRVRALHQEPIHTLQ